MRGTKIGRIASFLNPCMLTLFAVPAFIFLLPDGIPFSYAGCGSALSPGKAAGGAVNKCEDCVIDGSTEVDVSNCTLSTSSEKCEMTASVTIWVNYDCDVFWNTTCSGNCGNTLAISGGPTGPTSISKTHTCAAANDNMTIALVRSTAQGRECHLCVPFTFVETSATCTSP
jgi:hypothetical protein